MKHPYYPIVYIRGYAGSQGEVEDTVADPYMGFNVGATKVRQKWTGDVHRHVFESPLIRLMKDLGYRDVFHEGAEIYERQRLPDRSVWIYRYYEPASRELGNGVRPEMEDYARGLADFLARLRFAYTEGDPDREREFRVYLVAHSMGGLVARCYLQNIRRHYVARRRSVIDPNDVTPDPVPVHVDKLFTYATPHGGIDFRLIGNIPRFLQVNNTENFNTDRMREYLAIEDDNTPVNSLDGQFDPQRCFSLIGTNARDYRVAHGLSSAAVGPMSDGLVQIKNAYVAGSPRAFVHRAHSGHYGIVNSESGYQNLRRFLFGDLRVDGRLHIDAITLPGFAQRALDDGRAVRASYYVECVTCVRGADWDLSRRLASEECAILAKFDEHVAGTQPAYLFSAFLSKAAIVSSSDAMMFALDIGIQVPRYEIDGRVRRSRYLRDGYIFRDKLNLKIAGDGADTRLYYGWDRDTPNEARKHGEVILTDDGWRWRTAVQTERDPRVVATLEITGSAWNQPD